MLYTKLTNKALKLASNAHAGQIDKAGMPYILHPYYVASQMETEDETVVALLHDVVEDTELTIDDLKAEGFVDHIIQAISLLTKTSDTDYNDYIEKISINKIATKVKIADMKHNSIIGRNDDPDEWVLRLHKKYEKSIKILETSLKPKIPLTT
jgi:(p)ppGpp synthase/HD superfamily hydrolase